MMLGSIDGYEVCRRLRADAVLGARAIVMLTAQARDRDEETAINAGAAAFVRKPFSPLELSKLVERLLRASRRATPVHPSTGDPSL
jgi:DNA-binding response OmpR family regulator